ncbi:MAG: HvfX family Cu-binding RiPP maturation protein [Thiobacillus sp.]
MVCATKCASRGLTVLDDIGSWFGMLSLRLFIAFEFWQSGLEKFSGTNWFADIQTQFPFPFSVMPVDFSWWLATWIELIGAVLLIIGLGTRFWAFAFVILDIVAWYAVHASSGYNVCDNGYKLPLMYLMMLIPLVLMGPGKLSMDSWLRSRFTRA